MQGASLSTVALGATLPRPAKDSSINRHQNSLLEPLLLKLSCSEKASRYERLPMRVISVKSTRFNNQGSRVGPFLVVQANPSKKDNESQQLPQLANTLLMNAASLIRPERSTAYCIVCRGQGYITCSVCKGAGILEPERVAKMNSMKHAVNKFRSLLFGGASRSMYDQDWVKSNRCKRCSGTGKVVCSVCEGTGRRRP